MTKGNRNEAVKPCPFCGVVPTVEEPSGGEYVIECRNAKCPTAPNAAFATGCSVAGLHRPSVIERWNTRHTE
jgi:hypothetical protein